MRSSASGPFGLPAESALVLVLVSLLGLARPAAAGDAPLSPGASVSNQTQDAAPPGAPTDGPQAAPAADTTQTLNEVVVTGSLIKQPSLTGSAALQVVNAQDIKAAGTQTIETLLDSMPSVQGNFSLTQTSNPGGARGVASVDLRGLGPSRTLTLIDGKRVMPGDPLGGPEADLNFIPPALIDRVDVLTGGASAIYGSARSGPRLRCGAGKPLAADPGSWRLPLAGWRQELAPSAVRQRDHWRSRSEHRSA